MIRKRNKKICLFKKFFYKIVSLFKRASENVPTPSTEEHYKEKICNENFIYLCNHLSIYFFTQVRFYFNTFF